jgi:glycerol uptake facilitator-like aquaporin
MKKYIAEAIGAGTLTLVVGLSLAGTFPVSTPILAALTLGLFVYSMGHVSGTHINPAVTIGVWSIGKISNKDAVSYVAAQFFGALVALGLLGEFNMVTGLEIDNSFLIGIAEMLGTFFFAFGIASVVYGRTPGSLSGLMIGGSLLLGIAISAMLGANGVLNPAVAFGISSFGAMYILGPVLGAVLGMQVYKYLQG